ncbi:MAG TPA: hypothetical protein ENI80_10340 [Acidiferrobacteraceae bacterium]|nr:hypothetical protein [Acidiferrobacteraceae bacterium]
MVYVSILIALLFGTAVVVLLTGFVPRKPSELIYTASIGYGIGIGATSCLLFIWMVFAGGITATYFIFEFTIFILVVAIAVSVHRQDPDYKKKSVKKDNGGKPVLLVFLFYVLLVLAIVGVVLYAKHRPHGSWDAWAIWNVRARYIYRLGGLWEETFLNDAGMQHIDYPLMLPLAAVRSWSLSGEETVGAPMLIGGMFALSTLGLLSSSVSMARGINQGYIAGLTLLGTYIFLKYSAKQVADIPLGLYFLSGVSIIYLVWQGVFTTKRFYRLCGLCLGLAIWTKNEGILLAACVIASSFAMSIYRGSIKAACAVVINIMFGLAPIVVVVVYFKLHYAPENDVINYDSLTSSVIKLVDFGRYIQIAAHFLKTTVTFGPGISVFLLIYYLGVGRDRKLIAEKNVYFITLSVLLALIGYFYVYIITPQELSWHLETSFSRLLLQLWPTILLAFFAYAATPYKWDNTN